LANTDQKRFSQILSMSPAIIYACRAEDLKATFVSDNITTRFGYTIEECLEDPDFWFDNLHPDDRDRILASHDKVFTEGCNFQEYRFRKKNGEYVWIYDEVRLVADEAGKPVEIIGSWLDISDRKKTEGLLKVRERLFRELFDSNPIPTIITDPAGVVFKVNPAFTVTTGYSSEDVVGRTSQEMGFWRNIEDRERMVAAIQEHGAIDNLEAQFFGKDNKPMTCIVSSRAVEHGGEVRMLSTVIDVTKRRKAEEERRQSEQLFRDFFTSNPIPTIISSLDGMIYMTNSAFLRAGGFTEDEVVGRTAQELGFWRKPADRDRMVAAIRAHGFIDNMESVFYDKEQKERICLVSSRAIEFENETRILTALVDVTEQKKAEETMRELEKAKSDFISTAAHELRTPLIAIVGYCELLGNAATMDLSGQQKEDFLGVIQTNAEILNRLVDDLLDIGRIQLGRSLGIQPVSADLKSVVEKVVASFKLKSSRHEIVLESDADFPEALSFDVSRVNQVLHNLVNNAIKYSPNGGMIKIILSRLHNKVEISVIDQGIGMSAQQVEHVFDRFYRAEGTSEAVGLGLGMSIVKQIVLDHGGDINVTSFPGKGTTVSFVLPL
jgi:PAS domain S-box-containing protein